jgi:hypothetical protein
VKFFFFRIWSVKMFDFSISLLIFSLFLKLAHAGGTVNVIFNQCSDTNIFKCEKFYDSPLTKVDDESIPLRPPPSEINVKDDRYRDEISAISSLMEQARRAPAPRNRREFTQL